MIPPRFANLVFILLLTAPMSLIVTGISTLRAFGPAGFAPGLWITAWGASCAVAFPGALVVTPLTRRLVDTLVRHDGKGAGHP